MWVFVVGLCMLWGFVTYVGRDCGVQVWGLLFVFSVEDVELPPSLGSVLVRIPRCVPVLGPI